MPGKLFSIAAMPTQVQYMLMIQPGVANGNPNLNVPPALAGNLRKIKIDFHGFLPEEPSGNIKVDLAGFAECQFLEGVEVDLSREYSPRGEVTVCGLGQLPAACKGVVLVLHPDGGDLYLRRERGWQFDSIDREGGPRSKICVWRVEFQSP